MKRFFLILCIFYVLVGHTLSTSAQSFTGRVTGVQDYAGRAGAPGIFASPVGSTVSGSFLINPGDFGPGKYYPNTTGYGCSGNWTIYTGQSSGTSQISMATSFGTATMTGSQSLNLGPCDRTMSFGNVASFSGILPGVVIQPSSYLDFGCRGGIFVAGTDESIVGYSNQTLSALPLSFPVDAYSGATCYGTISLSAYVTMNGSQYPYVLTISIELVYPTGTPAPVTEPTKLIGNPKNYPGCACAGDPITLATGNVYLQESDYSTAGPNVLSFVRSYNSLADPSSLATTLGSGWRSNYDRYLRLSPSSVVAERADGQELTFTSANGSWVTDSDVDVTLTNTGSVWTLVDKDDTTETYSAISPTEALLSTSQNRNGYTHTLSYNGSQQLKTVTDSYGRTLSFAYLNGLLHAVTTPDKLTLTFTVNASGTTQLLTSVTFSTMPSTSRSYQYQNSTYPFALTGIIDENGKSFEYWNYDAFGRAISSLTGSSAEQTTIAYDGNTGNATVTNALGQSTLYVFSSLQGILKLTEADRLATSTTSAAKRLFTFDLNGYPASQTDWSGNMTTFVNDAHGQPTTIVEAGSTPQARTTSLTYDTTWIHLPKQIVRPGITTNFTYDASGNLHTRTDTDTTTTTAPYTTKGQTRAWTFTWNAYGLLATAQTARTDLNATSHYYYDSTYALSKITNPLSQNLQITSNTAGGRPQTMVDANGVTTQLVYDARQRLTSRAMSTAAGTLTTSFGYDAAGNLIKTTLPDGSFLMNTYDTAHRLTQETDALGNYVTYTLDGLGDRTQTNVYPSGGTTPTWQSYGKYDALGREYLHTAGAGQTTTRQFDGNGNVLAIEDGLNHTTTNTYNARNRLATSTDANSGVTTPSYDTNGRIISLYDANGNTTAYVRDGFGEVIQQTSPDSGVSVFHYDGDGNLTSKTDALGIVTNQTFDALDRPLTTTYPAHAAENVAYTYDQTGAGFSFGIGRLTSVTDAAGALTRMYDERGNLLTEARVNGAMTFTTGYTYDGANRIASMTYPDGTLAGYQHDAAGYVSTVTAKLPGASNTTTLAKLTHQPFGPITSATFGNGVAENWLFDQSYRPTNLTDALSGTNLQKLTYGYDLADNVKTITDATSASNSQTFGYDTINRLTSAVSGAGGYGTFGWKYDNVGNRLEQTQGASVTSYGYTPGTNRLLTISTSTKMAMVRPAPSRNAASTGGGYLWANAPPKSLPKMMPDRGTTQSSLASPRFSGYLGWPVLLAGFAGLFTIRKRLRAPRLLAILSLAAILTGSATLISGCISGLNKTSSTPPITGQFALQGMVHGGQQPITGATIQLYSVGTTADGAAATPLVGSKVLTSPSGSFSITSAYTCPSTTAQVYLTATGGNPGLANGTNNNAIALMAALGSCGSLSSLSSVTINELTTVGSLAALYPYMGSVSSLGFPEAAQLTTAFALANEYANIVTGSVPGKGLPTGYYASSIEIQTLADALAACINSNGAITSTSPCGMLFALAAPAGGTAPTDTIGALLNILKNPTSNIAGILGLVSASAPFQPTLTSPPSSWNFAIIPLPAPPVFSVAAGTYSGALTVTLSSTIGTSIYYTTDGTAPSAASPKYGAAIPVSSTKTINAIAQINPYVTSSIGTAAYTISGTNSSSNVTVATNANGNITSIPPANSTAYATFAYNNANRLASVTGSPMAATFVYDWAGQRFSKTDGGTPASVYSYSQNGAVIAENDGGTVTDYIYADGRPIAVLQPGATPAANQVNYVTADRLGTPQVLTNSDGGTVWNTSYQPFGTTGTIAASVNQNLRFPGQIADAETGFSYNLNRDYMPNLGRYLEADPIGLADGPNIYLYAHASPPRIVDRSGLAGGVEEDKPYTEGDGGNAVFTRYNFYDILNQIRQIDPGNSALDYISTSQWEPTAQDVASAEAALSELQTQQGQPASLPGQCSLTNSAPDYLVDPLGNPIGVPIGSKGPNPTDNNNGDQYTGGQGGNGLADNVNNVRIMGPKPGYPNGYVNYGNTQANGGWQTVNPWTGKPIGPSDPAWHIPR